MSMLLPHIHLQKLEYTLSGASDSISATVQLTPQVIEQSLRDQLKNSEPGQNTSINHWIDVSFWLTFIAL